MNRTGVVTLGAVVAVILLVGCSSPQVTAEPDDVATAGTASTAPSEPSSTPVPGSTREDPISFGSAAVVQEIGEAGGDAWKVTVSAPSDITQVIVDEAVELYHGDEKYVSTARPPEGQIYLGVQLDIERLLDIPEDPASALDVEFITSDGRTLQTTNQYSYARPPLMDVGEMYGSATATATEVFLVPAGTTGQVLVTERNSGARFYFG